MPHIIFFSCFTFMIYMRVLVLRPEHELGNDCNTFLVRVFDPPPRELAMKRIFFTQKNFMTPVFYTL